MHSREVIIIASFLLSLSFSLKTGNQEIRLQLLTLIIMDYINTIDVFLVAGKFRISYEYETFKDEATTGYSQK